MPRCSSRLPGTRFQRSSSGSADFAWPNARQGIPLARHCLSVGKSQPRFPLPVFDGETYFRFSIPRDPKSVPRKNSTNGSEKSRPNQVGPLLPPRRSGLRRCRIPRDPKACSNPGWPWWPAFPFGNILPSGKPCKERRRERAALPNGLRFPDPSGLRSSPRFPVRSIPQGPENPVPKNSVPENPSRTGSIPRRCACFDCPWPARRHHKTSPKRRPGRPLGRFPPAFGDTDVCWHVFRKLPFGRMSRLRSPAQAYQQEHKICLGRLKFLRNDLCFPQALRPVYSA